MNFTYRICVCIKRKQYKKSANNYTHKEVAKEDCDRYDIPKLCAATELPTKDKTTPSSLDDRFYKEAEM